VRWIALGTVADPAPAGSARSGVDSRSLSVPHKVLPPA